MNLLIFLWLIFCQVPSGAHDLGGSVFRMSRDGSQVMRLSDQGTVPIWSPDGQRILFVQHSLNHENALFRLISPAGLDLVAIPVPSPLKFTGSASWHPNGTEIAFGGTVEWGESYDIYSMELHEGRPARRIISDGILPAWSPNGQQLAFTTNRDSNMEVYLMDRAGRLRNLTQHRGLDARPSWSPNGSRIAFESDRFGDFEILIIEIVGGEVTRLTNNPAKDWNPSWSPDGHEIAFVSNRDGGEGIYRMSADGTNFIRLSMGHDTRNWQIAWSPDGQSICFVSNRQESYLDRLSRWFSAWQMN